MTKMGTACGQFLSRPRDYFDASEVKVAEYLNRNHFKVMLATHEFLIRFELLHDDFKQIMFTFLVLVFESMLILF